MKRNETLTIRHDKKKEIHMGWLSEWRYRDRGLERLLELLFCSMLFLDPPTKRWMHRWFCLQYPSFFYVLLVEHVERERSKRNNTILQHIRATISMSCRWIVYWGGGEIEGEIREADCKFITSLCTRTKKFYERNRWRWANYYINELIDWL